ncbi:hypothetical protein [Aestuariimicrobium sp. Y1814]|uniref:hypothetical protein n=1 Tax=Aestuariimicrobium sp. Y1814 TaxID=3418742 RepID=UPI003DA735ED
MGFNPEAARQALADLQSAQRAKWRAEAEELRLLTVYADHCATLPADNAVPDTPEVPGAEQLVAYGDDGTPLVAEFASLEAAAVLKQREEQVRLDIGQALSLRHRLPLLWSLTLDGQVRVWQARQLVQLVTDLTAEQAGEWDPWLVELVTTMTFTRVRRLVKARVMALLPEAHDQAHDYARAARRVDFNDYQGDATHLGTTYVTAVLDTVDARFLKAQVDRIAGILHTSGSTAPIDQRRAMALGVLASPARALQLLQADATHELPELVAEQDLEADCPARGQRGHVCGTITTDPAKLLPRADLLVHLTAETLQTRDGLVRIEGVGPVLAGWVTDWLGHTRVSVRPVLHPDRLVPTDNYECPPSMREWVRLRNPYDAFPYSTRRAGRRGMDLDHTIPWHPRSQGPDQEPLTRPDNLGYLSRKAHRAKTHAGWQLSQPTPGTFLWRSPLGFGYLVTPSHTWLVEDPTGQVLPPQQQPPPRLPLNDADRAVLAG